MENELFSAIEIDLLASLVEGPRTFDELLAWGKAEFAPGSEEHIRDTVQAAIRRLVTRGLIAVSQCDDLESKTLDAAEALSVLDDAAASTLFVVATSAGRAFYAGGPIAQ